MKITRHKINQLKKSDKRLAELIEDIGLLNHPANGSNHLKNASRIIVDQQISYKAARAIWNRLDSLVGKWDAARFNELDIQSIRNAGLSNQKANYIKTLASSLHTKSFSFNQLTHLDNDDATQQLIKIKGFGKWSAAMFLIFSLDREDVFSPDDAGLKRAVIKIYDLDEESYSKNIEKISEKWSPYRSIASLYLWAWHDNA